MKKLKLIQSMIASCVLIFMLAPSVTTVLGSEELTDTKFLNLGQMCSSCDEVTRTTKYSYVSFKCNSVYPKSGWDTFTKMQARVANQNQIGISNMYIFTEGKGYGIIPINEGKLDAEVIRVQVRGNNPDCSAWANFTYKPN